MTKTSILGCGWLGLPLAKTMINNGHLVNGSTTSIEKMDALRITGISPFLLSLSSQSISGEIELFLSESNILIIDIPPKIRGNNIQSFVYKIKTLIPYIEKSTIENVLFISSTSVYGENNSLVTEITTLNPDSESGRQLVIVESLLQKNTHFKTTILRFGGLIGEDRNPIIYLSGRENIENPDAPINLIHQEDCIGIIQTIITKNKWNEVYNAVTPYHPSRKEYYSQKAITLQIALPKFAATNSLLQKTIDCTKVEKVLGYTFIKTSL